VTILRPKYYLTDAWWTRFVIINACFSVVWISLSKISRINYDLAVNKYLDRTFFLYIKGYTLVLAIVDIYEREKFPSTLFKVGLRIFLTLMVLEGKDSEGGDSLGPTEFLNTKCSRGFAKHLPIEI
jgi:hypothetical protein